MVQMCHMQLIILSKILLILESVDEIHTVDTSVAHLLANSECRHNKRALLVYRSYIDWRWTNKLYDLEIRKI